MNASSSRLPPLGIISSAVAVITLRNPFRAAVALIVSLLSVALIFLLQRAPFVAMIQIIVYAGAIVVLFLFVIAYLGDKPPAIGVDPLARYQVLAWLAIIGLGIEGFLALGNSELPGIRSNPDAGVGHRQPAGHRACVPRSLHRGLRGHLAGALGRGDRRRTARAPGRARGARPMTPSLSAAIAHHQATGVPLSWYLALSGVLFLIGLLGVMTRRNPLLLLLAVELMLNSANIALVGFSRYWNVSDGQIFALVVMVVAAAEVVIGLGLVVAVYRQRLALDVDALSRLKG